jgi:hypothetical protein
MFFHLQSSNAAHVRYADQSALIPHLKVTILASFGAVLGRGVGRGVSPSNESAILLQLLCSLSFPKRLLAVTSGFQILEEMR